MHESRQRYPMTQFVVQSICPHQASTMIEPLPVTVPVDLDIVHSSDEQSIVLSLRNLVEGELVYWPGHQGAH